MDHFEVTHRRTADPEAADHQPIDRRDAYRMVIRIAKATGIRCHISPNSLRHAAITNALDAGVSLRDAQILARHADPRTTEHYDRVRGNHDCHGVHVLTAYSPAYELLRTTGRGGSRRRVPSAH